MNQSDCLKTEILIGAVEHMDPAEIDLFFCCCCCYFLCTCSKFSVCTPFVLMVLLSNHESVRTSELSPFFRSHAVYSRAFIPIATLTRCRGEIGQMPVVHASLSKHLDFTPHQWLLDFSQTVQYGLLARRLQNENACMKVCGIHKFTQSAFSLVELSLIVGLEELHSIRAYLNSVTGHKFVNTMHLCAVE
jgi:hypothetical protein